MKAKAQGRGFWFSIPIVMALVLGGSFVVALVTAQQSSEALTGNWVVRTPNNDGTWRTTYLNLKQEGPRITGTIRVTQFFYRITESTGGPDGFDITGSMMDGKSERKVQYEGKLAWLARRRWAGTVGTSSRVAWMMRPCAVSPTQWQPTE